MLRRIAATFAALAMLLVLAVPVVAGGWAEIVADAQTTKPPVEGTPIEVGFKVMQHGVTPAPWETATVHFVDVSSGDKIDVVAANDNPNGHFAATATLPHAGYWSWQVTLQNLESSQVPVSLAVRTADGRLPAFDPASTMAAIERAKAQVSNELTARFSNETARLEGQAQADRVTIATLSAQVGAMKSDRTKLADRVAALEGGNSGLPLLALISIAALAGAAAGFAMAWLAGRPVPTPTVPLSPAPRGVDPA
jgi:hypothetical protein